MYKEIQGAWEKIKKALVLSSSLWFKGGNVFNYMNEKKKSLALKLKRQQYPQNFGEKTACKDWGKFYEGLSMWTLNKILLEQVLIAYTAVKTK